MEVAGNKIVYFDSKAGEQGYIEDRFGNEIYRTDSKLNQERLAALQAQDESPKPKAKETLVQKARKAVKRSKK